MKRIFLLGMALVALATYHGNPPIQAQQKVQKNVAPYTTWWIQVAPSCVKTEQTKDCSRMI